jgi:uncharacterized protein (UPF0332 family)
MGLAPGSDPVLTKTHSGLISAFGLHLVKTGGLPIALGKSLNRAHEIRQIADYTGDDVSAGHAKDLVEQADIFVNSIDASIRAASSGGSQPT